MTHELYRLDDFTEFTNSTHVPFGSVGSLVMHDLLVNYLCVCGCGWRWTVRSIDGIDGADRLALMMVGSGRIIGSLCHPVQ